MKHLMHNKIIETHDKICKWFHSRAKKKFSPFYVSFDIRDSGYKIAPVDANLYPAGFNNICQIDKESCYEWAYQYISSYYGLKIHHIGLLVENHTSNFYYWDNVYWIKQLLSEAGYKVSVLIPKEYKEKFTMKSSSGFQIEILPFCLESNGKISIDSELDLIISNNDFSADFDLEFQNLNIPINPPIAMGWNSRRKSSFFEKYNGLVEEFCDILDVESNFLKIKTEKFEHFDLEDRESVERLSKINFNFSKGFKKKSIKNLQLNMNPTHL